MKIMSEVKYTPGPWKISDRTPDNKGYAAFALDIDQERGFFTSLASVWCGNESPDANEKATAKLIAAAPELLLACEIALSYLDLPTNEITRADYDQIKNAIKKATQ